MLSGFGPGGPNGRRSKSMQTMLVELAEEAGLYLEAPEPTEDPGAQITRPRSCEKYWVSSLVQDETSR